MLNVVIDGRKTKVEIGKENKQSEMSKIRKDTDLWVLL